MGRLLLITATTAAADWQKIFYVLVCFGIAIQVPPYPQQVGKLIHDKLDMLICRRLISNFLNTVYENRASIMANILLFE